MTERSGRPITEMNPANFQKIKHLIEENRQLPTYNIEELTSLSRPIILRILHDHLEMGKLSARWIPHYLNYQNKAKRLEFCKLVLGKQNTEEWRMEQILTGDESILYHRKIQKRSECAAWKRQGESPGVIVKRSRYETKTMFVIFIRSTGPVLVHAVDRCVTIDDKYYIENA